MTETPTDVDAVATAVLTASRVLVAISARSLAGIEETVTLTQFRTLVVLHSHGEMNLNTLADILDVSSSTALRMVDRLLNADLVSRHDNPSNRREVVLGLTHTGEQLVKKVTAKRRREITAVIAAMPATRRHSLVLALTAFADAAGEPAASDQLPDW